MKSCVVNILVPCLSAAVLASGCSNGRPADAGVADADSAAVADTTAADTIEAAVTEQQMPTAADELFDDFIFNFAANRRLQMKRVKFPLKVTDGDKTAYIEKRDWKMETFFMNQGYYTLIFDNARQMEVVKDTSINKVVVEKVNLTDEKVKKYMFERKAGRWMLTGISTNEMVQNTNASFLAFYRKFATDPKFQVASLNNPVMFSGPDPDDDFSTMTGEIAPETWPAFAPELPSDFIYNIMYGQKYSEGVQKIFVLRGISNGMEMQLKFRRIDGDWKLTDLSE